MGNEVTMADVFLFPAAQKGEKFWGGDGEVAVGEGCCGCVLGVGSFSERGRW